MANTSMFELFATLKLDSKEFDSKLKTVSKVAGATMKAAAAGAVAVTGAAAAGVASISKSAIGEYADYEQLVGGVDTLFGDSSSKVQEFAKDAFKNVGLSANQYMETVTGFSASLLQSLDGDTSAAADKADLAITDMADNANKMGSSMESIQNAYSGFAKQNYTMLDNLKLGYGGTKSEMERLIKDAEKLDKSFSAARDENGDLSLSYGDIIDAIHVVQTNMGITGTTAKEASETISGSVSTMQSAWTNLLTGMSDSDQDIGGLVSNFAESVITVADNIVPRIVEILPTIVSAIEMLVERLLPYIGPMLEQLLPVLVESVIYAANTIVEMLPTILPIITAALPQLIDGIIQIMPALLGALWDSVVMVLGTLWSSFIAPALEKVGEFFVAVWEFVSGWFKKVGEFFKGIAGWVYDNALKPIIDKVTEMWEKVVAVWDMVVGPWIEIIKRAGPWAYENVVVPIIEKVTGLWSSIKEVFAAVGTWFWDNVASPVINRFTQIWNTIKEGAAKAWEGIKTVFKPVTDWFTNVFKKAWEGVKKVFEVGGRIFSGIKEGIANTFKTVVNGLIRGINAIIAVPFNAINGMFDKLRAISILGISPFAWISNFGVPAIPQLERGGILKKGQIGLLEGNGAEAVVPLDKSDYWLNSLADKIGGRTGDIVININVDGYGKDKTELANELAEVISNRISNQYARGKAVFA